jgi:hypothetical protein
MKQRLFLLAIVGLLPSCGGREGYEDPVLPFDASVVDTAKQDAAVEREAPEDFGCSSDETTAPTKLECTGLYSEWATKTVATGVREFTPSSPLWSDGADKHRWVYLPPGTKIDASSRTDWVFPVGTKFWKEFRVRGKRIETRLFKKLRADRWVTAAYAWSNDETSTTSSMGGDLSDVQTVGQPYHIATQKECSDCHKGRQDRILGFEEISLGGPNATGYTLAALVAEGRLSPPPPSVETRTPDDGTGVSTPALAWIHVNCGITCHNRNSDATGNGTKMFLRLDPSDFGSKPHSEWDVFQTTVRARPITPAWAGETRIVPGAPERSLLVRLISSRGLEQMPPIGTHLIDQANVEVVKAWIARMTPDPIDAGSPDAADGSPPDVVVPPDRTDDDAGADAGIDGAPPDVSAPDAGPPEGGPPDAGAPDTPDGGTADDAGIPDAGTPDSGPPDDADANDPSDAGHGDGEDPIDSGHDIPPSSEGGVGDDATSDAGAPDGGTD